MCVLFQEHMCGQFGYQEHGFPDSSKEWEGIRNFAGGAIFLLGGENLRRSGFDHSNYFKSQKQLSVNTEHQLKSKLAWPVCQKSIKLKQK